MEREGIDNAIAKFGIGLAGDILLDPSTYIPGKVFAKIFGVAGKGLGKGVSLVDKVAPGFKQGIDDAGGALADLFVAGRGASEGGKGVKGVVAGTRTALGEAEIASKEVADKLYKDLGDLSKDQAEMMALGMASAKIAEFKVGKGTVAGIEAAKYVVSKIPDKVVRDKIITTADYIREYSIKQGMDANNLYHIYYPTSDVNRLKKAMSGTMKGKLIPGTKAYEKQFKNLVGLEDIEKSPIEALFRVQSEQATNKIYADELQRQIKEFGKPVNAYKSAEEAAKDGFVMLKEKGGMIGKELGWVTKDDFKFLQTQMDPGSQYKAINAFAKATGFDAVTNLFKRSVTGLFAPFHTRNYVSGMIQGYEEIGHTIFHPKANAYSHLIAAGKNMDQTVNLGGIPYKLGSIRKLLQARFGMVQGAATEGIEKRLVPVPGALTGKAFKKTLKNPLGQDSQVFRTARAVTQYTEMQNKANIVLGSLMKGDDIEKALVHAEKGAFDYGLMTSFESNVMRRLVPFYSFTRKNVELQARTLRDNPQRVSNVFKFIRDLGSNMSAEEKESLPDYMKDAFNIKTGTDEFGQLEVTSQLGTPIEQFTQLFSGNPVLNAISQMNPILKVPLELGTGVDSFRERDIKLTYDAKEYSAAPNFIKDFLKIREIEKPIYKNGKPTGETKTQYVSNPERLLIVRSLFTSRGVSYLDQMFDGDMSEFSRWLKSTTGLKPQVIDEQTTQFFKDKEKTDNLSELLKRYNIISKYQSNYISDNNVKNLDRFRR